ncbi:MAG: hypothetical protein KZQ83_14785 [gamma proteobacterium symbiont of Taylorina sp.]|nr:hypothetical protein [gamma proteobacterium symbiont of Taylorina sp.]
MKKTILLSVLIFILLQSSATIAGKIYKCKSLNGAIEFKNTPCTGSQSGAIVKINKAPENTGTPWYKKNTIKRDSDTKDNVKSKPEAFYKKRSKSESELCKSHKYFYEQTKKRGPLPGARGKVVYKSQLATQKSMVDISCR